MSRRDAALLVLAGLFLGGCAIGATGCRAAPAASQAPLPVRIVRVGCLTAGPPPTPPPIALVTGVENGCPAMWESCGDADTIARLATYMDELEAWSRDAWIACRDRQEEEP